MTYVPALRAYAALLRETLLEGQAVTPTGGGAVASQRLVHDIRKTAVHPLDHMRVRVEGDAYAGVP